MIHRPAAAELLLKISRCIEVPRCLHGDKFHPCHEVVSFAQSRRSVRDDFHQPAPEPWIGHIERAPLLFIGPNPGGQSVTEELPAGFAHFGADKAVIRRSTDEAFDRTHEWPRFDDPSHWRTSADWVSYLPHCGFIFRPGIGIDRRRQTRNRLCSYGHREMWLRETNRRKRRLGLEMFVALPDEVLTLSPASVLITLGKIARETMKKRFGLTGDVVAGPSTIQGRDRYVLFLPHPRQPVHRQRIPERLTAEQLHDVLGFLRSRQSVSDPIDQTLKPQSP